MHWGLSLSMKEAARYNDILTLSRKDRGHHLGIESGAYALEAGAGWGPRKWQSSYGA
jgi:hypothetical protein